jgi:hypothetical protein
MRGQAEKYCVCRVILMVELVVHTTMCIGLLKLHRPVVLRVSFRQVCCMPCMDTLHMHAASDCVQYGNAM